MEIKETKTYLGYTVLYLGLLAMLFIIAMLFSLSLDNPYYKYVILLFVVGAVLASFNIFFILEKSRVLSVVIGVVFIIPIMCFVVYATGGRTSNFWILMVIQVLGWAFYVPALIFYSAIGVLAAFFLVQAYFASGGVFSTQIYFYEFLKIATIFLFGIWIKSILQEMQRFKSENLQSLEQKNKITQKLLSSFIASLSTAIARKDAGIQRHSERVIAYCSAIARALKLSVSDQEKLFMAAMLHDVGKMSISDSILKKRGKLTRDEYEIVKKHPLDALTILEHIEEFKGILIYVKYHHERWDGKGYPEGLKGEMIPLIARVLIVANAYDAMTTEKPYQAKMSKGEAISELKQCRGTQFDPKVVDVLVKLLEADSVIGPI